MFIGPSIKSLSHMNAKTVLCLKLGKQYYHTILCFWLLFPDQFTHHIKSHHLTQNLFKVFCWFRKNTWVKCTTYTRCSQKFQVHHSEIPPIIAPSIRLREVLHRHKKAVYWTASNITTKVTLFGRYTLFLFLEHCVHFTLTGYLWVFCSLFDLISSDISRWSSCLTWPHSRRRIWHIQNKSIEPGECQEHLWNICLQSNVWKTSYQESENHRNNILRL